MHRREGRLNAKRDFSARAIKFPAENVEKSGALTESGGALCDEKCEDEDEKIALQRAEVQHIRDPG